MLAKPRVFDDDHLPRRLQHREGAVDTLLRAWDPGRHGDATQDVLVHGPQGVGKTVVTRHALQRIERETPLQSARVRCLGESTAGVLRGVLEDLPGSDPHRTTPVDELRDALGAQVDGPTIVVLDEADDLPATDALPILADARHLSLVAICHDSDDWLARVDDRVRRRLGTGDLGLSRYGVDELADILAARARAGLPDGVVTRSQLRQIADESAGVARRGIQALRAAAELAAERGHATIEDADVADAHERARQRIRTANLASLPVHHQVLYALLREAGPITPAELYDAYDAVADAIYADRDRPPISRRDRRRKLDKLAAYDLVAADGDGRDRELRVCDRAIEPAIDLAHPDIQAPF